MKHAAPIALLLLLLPMQAAALSTDELLSLIAMPLAVAAVSNVTGVPAQDLGNLVASLNQADLPPVQIIEVIRYAPVALVVENEQPAFVQFVQTEVTNGVRGPALVNVITQRLRTFDVTPQIALASSSRIVVIDDNFVPQVVRTRVERIRTHPHGGPPGQIKKVLGLQTGAEVVHGQRQGGGKVKVKARDVAVPVRVVEQSRGNDKGQGKAKGEGKAKGQGKGKGKG